MYALVKWTDWEEYSKVTPCVPIKWIIDFDLNRYKSAKERTKHSYVIKWEGGHRKYFPGIVLQVSGKITKLNDLAEMTGYEVSMGRRYNLGSHARSMKCEPMQALQKSEVKVEKQLFIQMGLKLLDEKIPKEVQIKSGLRDTTRSGKTYQRLDPKVLSEIFEYLERNFADTYDEDEMRRAISNHLCLKRKASPPSNIILTNDASNLTGTPSMNGNIETMTQSSNEPSLSMN